MGIEVIPKTLPWSGVLLAAVLPPASEATFSLPRIPLVLPWVLIPPGPSTSPYLVVVPKYDVTAERPVDVQVHLCDVPGGDQVLLSHFLWENQGGGAGIRDTVPVLSPGALLGREPWGHHGSVSC